MGRVTTVTCDHCEADLTTTSNCDDFRIVVKSERIPSAGGVVTAMHIEPDYSSPKYFCGNRCFSEWAKRNL